jgi:NADPH:quinone reductase-like Zn-dependent oxidoreductase
LRAWLLRSPGRAALEEVEVPEPGPGEVRLRITAAALNRHDVFARQGLKGPGIRDRTYPYVSGSDGAGHVDALGPGASGVEVGDAVAVYSGIGCGACSYCRAGAEPLCRQYRSWAEGPWGSLAEYAIAPARNLLRLSPDADLKQVAASTVTFTTAWHLLISLGRLRAGETVLVVGVGGGVALAALRIAHLAGGEVYAVSREDWKVERARELGAIAANHSRVEYDAWIQEQTGGTGADVVVDCNGAATWRRSIRSLAPGGRMLVCGATTGDIPEISIREMYQQRRQILGSPVGGRTDFDAVIPLIVEGRLSPVIHAEYPFDRVEEALAELEAGRQFGKILLTFH